MTIRVVLFDLMDTVVADPFREALTAACTVPLDELFRRRAPGLWPAFERGELDEATYWSRWAEDGLDVDPDRFHEVRRAGITWLPGMRDLLDDLEGHVVRATASNYPVWVEELEAGLLEGRFEHVVASHHLGVRKPDAPFYTRLLDQLGAQPHEACFVDDREVNVAAAEELGIASHRFVDAASCRSWLVELGVPIAAAPGSAAG